MNPLKKFIYLAFLLLILTGCHSSRQATHVASEKQSEQLVDYACKYKDAPYKYAGQTPQGFDCSGYVRFVYQHFGYTLPRSATEQRKEGKEVDRKDLRKGDLVFFKGRNQKSSATGHVGIVTQAGKNGSFQFIHSSTSKGVIIDDSETAYYRVRYLSAKRIILP